MGRLVGSVGWSVGRLVGRSVGRLVSWLVGPPNMAVGQNQWYHFGIGAQPIFVYFSEDWDVRWGYGILTHGHMATDSRARPLQRAGRGHAPVPPRRRQLGVWRVGWWGSVRGCVCVCVCVCVSLTPFLGPYPFGPSSNIRHRGNLFKNTKYTLNQKWVLLARGGFKGFEKDTSHV